MSSNKSKKKFTQRKTKKTEAKTDLTEKMEMEVENSSNISLNASTIKDEMKIGDILNSIDNDKYQSYYSVLSIYPLFNLKLKELDQFCKYFYGIIGRNPINTPKNLKINKENQTKENNPIKAFNSNINHITEKNNISIHKNEDTNYSKIFKSKQYLPVARKYWLSAKNVNIDKWFEYFKNLKNLRLYAEWKDDNGFNIIIWFKIPHNLSRYKMKEWNVHEFKGTFNSLYKKLSKNVNFTRIYPENPEENKKEINRKFKEKQNIDEDEGQKELQTNCLKNGEVNIQNEKIKNPNDIEPLSDYYSKPLKERISLRLNK